MAETQVVYIDVLFLTNFIINCALLLCTGRLLSQRIVHGRIAASAALGGIYAVCMFFPSFSALSFMGLKLIFAFSIVTLAFGCKNINSLLKCTAGFLAVSFMFGGAAFALYYFTPLGAKAGLTQNNGVFYIQLSLPTLLLFCALSYLVLNYSLFIFKRRVHMRGSIIDVTISLNEKSCVLRALCDTGNMLKSPVEHTPVLICELSALSELLDEEDISALSDAGECTPSVGIIFLPYSALGTKGAFIPAFFVDRAVYSTCEGDITKERVLVAVSKESLMPDGTVNALVNPDAFKSEVTEVEK